MFLARNNSMVCLGCPKSCLLSVTGNLENISVENNSCNKGLEFAKKELIDPERILTTTMRVDLGVLPLVSVRSDKPVKKSELKALIKQLDNIVLTAPVTSGQIVVSALGKNKVNIIATRATEKQLKNSPPPFTYGISGGNEKRNPHPWILSREECILNMLKKKNPYNVADIGANDMYNTKKLKSFAQGNVYAVDILFPENEIIKDEIICVNNIEKLPENEIDCVIMLDVLEHIKEDDMFYNKVVDKVKTNGILLITVPAWQFLFSIFDVRAQHYKRYNRKQLLKLLNRNDIKIERCHYFYTSLFFVRLLLLLNKEKFQGNEAKWNYSEKNVNTIIVKSILNIDFWINSILDKIFIHFPGLSLFAICRKK